MKCLYGTKCLCVETVTNLILCVLDISFSSFSLTVLMRLGGQLWEALPATFSLSYVVLSSTLPDPTSCHDWVVPRVLPLDLCGPLEAQMMKSVIRQVVQGGCMIRTGTG